MSPDEYSAPALAFLGDGVFDLLVRAYLVRQANRPAGQLHAAKIKHVNANAQAAYALKIMPALTEKETAVFRRGRNASSKNTAKNSSGADYHAATGLEALFGYLYLSGQTDRINELFSLICDEFDLI